MKAKKNPNRIGRKRRLTGWTLITLGLLTAAVWAASGWWKAGRDGDTWSVGVWSGEMWIRWQVPASSQVDPPPRPPTPPSAAARPSAPPAEWFAEYRVIGQPSVWSRWGWICPDTPADLRLVRRSNLWLISHGAWDLTGSGQPTMTYVWEFMLWPIPLPLWAAGGLLLRSGIIARRRANTGACAKCGYSLTGLTADAPCPECGKTIRG